MDENSLTKKDLSMKELKANTEDIVFNIIKEQNTDKIKDLTNLFNLNLTKKNTLRILKLDELLDQVQDNIVERFEKKPDEITNKELIEFMNIISTTLEKSQKNSQNQEAIPNISYNQQNNQVNINIANELSRESRERITEVIKNILMRANNSQEDAVYEDMEIKEENN